MATRQASDPEATRLPDAAVAEARSRLRGDLLRPDDAGYDAARTIWNAMINRRPAMIARCADAADVLASVRFAREHDLIVSVRGGPNVAGLAVCDGGLMIDLSPMQGLRVDPVAMAARVEPGVISRAFGLATVGGVVFTTGVAGPTPGGSQGWLTGKHGLGLDNLVSADVVTADGQLLRASDRDNPDLFWGLRGAGANCGIATSFEFRLHPIGPIVVGAWSRNRSRGRSRYSGSMAHSPTASPTS